MRNLLNARLELAFLFEIKDGSSPSWGILAYDGREKPRYQALKILNDLDGNQIIVDGEGTYVSAIASINPDKIDLVLTNYDEAGRNFEAVPVSFRNLDGIKYNLKQKFLDGRISNTLNLVPVDAEVDLQGAMAIVMPSNTIVELELTKIQ